MSNVSTQISNLESQLDLKLFNRETKGVTLTEEGQELYEIVNKSISSFDFAEKLAKDKNNMGLSSKVWTFYFQYFYYYTQIGNYS